MAESNTCFFFIAYLTFRWTREVVTGRSRDTGHGALIRVTRGINPVDEPRGLVVSGQPLYPLPTCYPCRFISYRVNSLRSKNFITLIFNFMSYMYWLLLCVSINATIFKVLRITR